MSDGPPITAIPGWFQSTVLMIGLLLPIYLMPTFSTKILAVGFILLLIIAIVLADILS